MASSKKWFLGFVIVALAASALGQTHPVADLNLVWAQEVPGTALLYVPEMSLTPGLIEIENKSYCSTKIKFLGHIKALKEIFPEDCGEPVLPTSAIISDIHVTDDLGRHCYAADQYSGEPTDVPAITEEYLAHLAHHKEDPCPALGYARCTYTNDEYEDRPTCADKSRILLTAENGEKWCHKPQTGVNK